MTDPTAQPGGRFLERVEARWLAVDDAVYYPAVSEQRRALIEAWRWGGSAAGQMAILTARPLPRVGASAAHLSDAADAAVFVVCDAYDGERPVFFERRRDRMPEVVHRELGGLV